VVHARLRYRQAHRRGRGLDLVGAVPVPPVLAPGGDVLVLGFPLPYFLGRDADEAVQRSEKLAEWLAEVYPWESVGDAMVFLVSGRPPRLAETLSATSDVDRATHSITFLPWVSEETVVQAYRATRRTLRDGQPSNRELPNDKTIRVLRFVTEQADDNGERPSWATLFDRWNADNPNEQYAERSAFRKAYNRAVKALVPPYRPLT
jgi:hypothetical protein